MQSVLGETHAYGPSATPSNSFAGITVALLGRNHPVGIDRSIALCFSIQHLPNSSLRRCRTQSSVAGHHRAHRRDRERSRSAQNEYQDRERRDELAGRSMSTTSISTPPTSISAAMRLPQSGCLSAVMSVTRRDRFRQPHLVRNHRSRHVSLCRSCLPTRRALGERGEFSYWHRRDDDPRTWFAIGAQRTWIGFLCDLWRSARWPIHAAATIRFNIDQ